MKRPRSVASHEVNVADYKSALRAWKKLHSGSYDAILGPHLVEDLRGVNPHHIVCLSSLLHDLIDRGLTNAMVVPSKLTQALQHIFGEDGNAGKPHGLDLYAHQVADHIRHCFNMIRVVFLDEQSVASRKTMKSKSFLRKCSTADYVVVRALASKLIIRDVSHSGSCAIALPAFSGHIPMEFATVVPEVSALSGSSAITLQAVSGHSPEGSAIVVPEVSEHTCKAAENGTSVNTEPAVEKKFEFTCKLPSWAVGLAVGDDQASSFSYKDSCSFGALPDCFGPLIGRTASRSSSVSSLASTLMYDDDAKLADSPGKILHVVPPPITPSTKERKKQILQVRANLKTISPDTKSKMPVATAKAAAATKGGPAATKGGRNAQGLDIALYKPVLSMSKPGVANCRAELCCSDKSGKRVYIFGSNARLYGPGLQENAKALRDYIQNNPGISKGDALKYRDALRAARNS